VGCRQVLHVFSAISLKFCFILDPRGRPGSLGGQIGSTYEGVEDNDDGILG